MRNFARLFLINFQGGFMPKSLGGLFGWLISTLIVVAVGLFVLSRIRPIWNVIMPPQG